MAESKYSSVVMEAGTSPRVAKAPGCSIAGLSQRLAACIGKAKPGLELRQLDFK